MCEFCGKCATTTTVRASFCLSFALFVVCCVFPQKKLRKSVFFVDFLTTSALPQFSPRTAGKCSAASKKNRSVRNKRKTFAKSQTQ
jgi:hypothetical protein